MHSYHSIFLVKSFGSELWSTYVLLCYTRNVGKTDLLLLIITLNLCVIYRVCARFHTLNVVLYFNTESLDVAVLACQSQDGHGVTGTDSTMIPMR